MTNVQSEIKDDQIVLSSEYRVSRSNEIISNIYYREKHNLSIISNMNFYDTMDIDVDAFLAIDAVIHSPSYHTPSPENFIHPSIQIRLSNRINMDTVFLSAR